MRSVARPLALAGLVLASATVMARTARADEWTGADKTAHFAVSAGIAAAAYAGGAIAFDARRDALIFGGAVAIAAGAGKELADLAGAGDPSWKDFTWDVLGTVAGLALAWGLDLAIRGVDERERPLFVSPSPSSGARGASAVFSF